MSILTTEQFDEFVEQCPEMEQFYDFESRYDSDTKDAIDDDMIFDFLREINPESTLLPENY